MKTAKPQHLCVGVNEKQTKLLNICSFCMKQFFWFSPVYFVSFCSCLLGHPLQSDHSFPLLEWSRILVSPLRSSLEHLLLHSASSLLSFSPVFVAVHRFASSVFRACSPVETVALHGHVHAHSPWNADLWGSSSDWVHLSSKRSLQLALCLHFPTHGPHFRTGRWGNAASDCASLEWRLVPRIHKKVSHNVILYILIVIYIYQKCVSYSIPISEGIRRLCVGLSFRVPSWLIRGTLPP